MRRAGRRSSGGLTEAIRRCCETNAAPLVTESTGNIAQETRTGVCRSDGWIVRSGIMAFGTGVNGQPWQSDASLISVGSVTELCPSPSVLSRTQIETQATNIQRKLSGSTVAINFLS